MVEVSDVLFLITSIITFYIGVRLNPLDNSTHIIKHVMLLLPILSILTYIYEQTST